MTFIIHLPLQMATTLPTSTTSAQEGTDAQDTKAESAPKPNQGLNDVNNVNLLSQPALTPPTPPDGSDKGERGSEEKGKEGKDKPSRSVEQRGRLGSGLSAELEQVSVCVCVCVYICDLPFYDIHVNPMTNPLPSDYIYIPSIHIYPLYTCTFYRRRSNWPRPLQSLVQRV